MRSQGYNVETFASAADFLASPRLLETACLIADVHMPAMTGIELYKKLIEAGLRSPNSRYRLSQRRRSRPGSGRTESLVTFASQLMMSISYGVFAWLSSQLSRDEKNS